MCLVMCLLARVAFLSVCSLVCSCVGVVAFLFGCRIGRLTGWLVVSGFVYGFVCWCVGSFVCLLV